MTEPAVASSDATNIAGSIVTRGGSYVINGRKWWTSGACVIRGVSWRYSWVKLPRTAPPAFPSIGEYSIYLLVHLDYLPLQLRLRNSHSDDVILPIAP